VDVQKLLGLDQCDYEMLMKRMAIVAWWQVADYLVETLKAVTAACMVSQEVDSGRTARRYVARYSRLLKDWLEEFFASEVEVEDGKVRLGSVDVLVMKVDPSGGEVRLDLERVASVIKDRYGIDVKKSSRVMGDAFSMARVLASIWKEDKIRKNVTEHELMVLVFSNDEGWTVAHELARMGYGFEDEKVLKLADDYGWTVAHEMAKQGYAFDDPEILDLEDEDGWTVEDVMKVYEKRNLHDGVSRFLERVKINVRKSRKSKEGSEEESESSRVLH
jgi:hypothetical protein